MGLGGVGMPSAADVAWSHALLAEAARGGGAAVLKLDVDLEKAFDSVDLARLAQQATEIAENTGQKSEMTSSVNSVSLVVRFWVVSWPR